MIYIDVSAAVHGRAGLGRYSENLAKALLRYAPREYCFFFNGAGDSRLPQSLGDVNYKQVPMGYKPWRLAVLAGQMARVSFNRLLPDVELYHATEHLLMPLDRTPAILTVHDLIYKRFPEYHKRLNYAYLNLAMPLFCRRASAIITVSDATRSDIVTYYGIDPAKITVVHEAAADSFRPPSFVAVEAVRSKYTLPDRYIVHIGTIEPRKNLSRLLDAFQIIKEDHPDLHLVLVGEKGWLYDEFFNRVESGLLKDSVRLLGWVPDEDMPAIIAGAELAVQPSLYEGFGLPVLEHMACGQVVAASRSSSHPEVGGKAAVYFDPEDVSDIAAAIIRLLNNSDEREHRRQLSLEQAEKFSWKLAAEKTSAIYNRLLGS